MARGSESRSQRWFVARLAASLTVQMTTGCKVACHDNSTRGLDASTALEYTRALRIATDVLSLTTILSIYQCGEQIYTCFDKVCVLYDGEMVYFGPMEEAVEYVPSRLRPQELI